MILTPIKHCRSFIKHYVMGTLHKAWTFPHLEYCCPPLLRVGRSQVKTPYDYLLNMVGIGTLQQRRKFQALLLVYRCINKQAPRYIQEFFNIKVCNYNLRWLGTPCLMLPNSQSRMAPRIIFILGRKPLGFFTPLCQRHQGYFYF